MGKIDKYIEMQKEFKKEYAGSLVGINHNHIHIETSYFLELFNDYEVHAGVNGLHLYGEHEGIEVVTVFDRDNIDLMPKLHSEARKFAEGFFNDQN